MKDNNQSTDILSGLDEARRYTEGDESAVAAVHKPIHKYKSYTATVKIRKDWPIKPEAAHLEGQRVSVEAGWIMDEDDPYPGEWAMLLGAGYPIPWIASGDLQNITPTTAPHPR